MAVHIHCLYIHCHGVAILKEEDNNELVSDNKRFRCSICCHDISLVLQYYKKKQQTVSSIKTWTTSNVEKPNDK